MPSKRKACLQERHLSDSRAQSLKRMESGTWLSRGLISCVSFVDAAEAMLYFLVSRPRHSARRTTSVPGMGAHRRSMGGKICLYRYHSMSGFRVEDVDVTSAGAYARLAVDSWAVVVPEAGAVMM